MENEKVLLYTLRGVISELETADRKKIDAAYKELAELESRHKDGFFLALALRAAELGVQVAEKGL